MTTRYTQDSTPTNPFGIGYFQQGVDTSKKLIAERQARDVELVAQSNAIDTRTPARELAAARASGDAQAIAAADAKYQAALAEKDAIQKEIEQNTALLASTEEGLRRNETALALAGAKAANTPPDTVIVNAGNDSAANSTPPVYTVPLNETTPNSLRAAPVTSETSTPAPTVAPTAQAAPQLPDTGDEALAAANAAQEVSDLRIASESATPVPPEDDGFPPPIPYDDRPLDFEAPPVDGETDALLEQQATINRAILQQQESIAYAPTAVPLSALNEAEFGTPNVVQNQADVNANNSIVQGLTNSAKNQSTLQTRVNQPSSADWRVRLSLAPNATYLYKTTPAGILAPLAATDGVIFPYTPVIETSYQAKYDSYDLTHSNYRGYFYKSSTVENISIKGTFTAQDTKEAEYLLAVIHFFKSVTKMFYGQDPQAGAPPPLVYLNGFGKYQFNENPCVVTNFGYSLPNDVDYIRATGFNNIGLNLSNRQNQSSGPSIGGSLGTVVAILDRLKNAGLNTGLNGGYMSDSEQIARMNQATAATNQNNVQSTYVPTKMEISITLLPMQTRNQVSKQFSLKSFANGSLLGGPTSKGFW